MTLALEHEILEKEYTSFFVSHGYTELDAVEITSRIDNTVYLVNSATNLFKPFLANDDTCIFVAQPSMRTQILHDYYCEEHETEYPTCFKSFGVYVSWVHLQKLIDDCIKFFVNIGFQIDNMRIRASYDDQILIDAAKKSVIGKSVEMDLRTKKYDHNYGSTLTGRAIKLDYYQEWASKYKNLCYFIIIYEDGVLKGAEMATSDQLILMRLSNIKYAISASKIARMLPTQSFIQRRFADSIVGVANLIYEHIRPNSSNTNGRTIRKYIKAASYFGELQNLSRENIINIIYDYIKFEYQSEFSIDVIRSYF